MTISRRKAISLIGGGIVLAATASTAGFVVTRTPHKALAPWQAAGNYQDPRKFALSLRYPGTKPAQPAAMDC